MSNNEIIENEEDSDIIEQEEVSNEPSGFSLFVDKIKVWMNKQNKMLVYGVTALLLVVLGYIGYQTLYQMPREKEGMSAIYKTQELFDNDSFRLVIKDAVRFSDEYSGTKAGNLSAYMAGASYLYTGDFKKAIEYLEDVSFSDQVMKYQAVGLLGDAYVENKDLDKGLSNYLKAYRGAKNEFSIVWWGMKAAKVYEKKNEWKEALDIYEKIKKEYPENEVSTDLSKYIARAQAKLNEY